MGSFAVDSFTDTPGTVATAHTPEAGGPIVSGQAGSAAVITAANRMRGNAANSFFLYSGVPASPNYAVEASVYCASNVNGFGLSVRAVNGNTGYNVAYSAGSGNITLSGGNLSPTSAPLSPTVGQRQKIKLQIANSSEISVFVDGSRFLHQFDTGIAATGLAGFTFAAQDTDSTGFQLDSFIATDATLSQVEIDGQLFVLGGSQLWVNSDNEIYLLGLTDLISGTPLNGATVSAAITTLSGGNVAGSTVNLTYVPGSITIQMPNGQTFTSASGNYRGQLPASVANTLADGTSYLLSCTAVNGSNQRVFRGVYTAGYSTK
jgi:hypothetical protein